MKQLSNIHIIWYCTKSYLVAASADSGIYHALCVCVCVWESERERVHTPMATYKYMWYAHVHNMEVANFILHTIEPISKGLMASTTLE